MHTANRISLKGCYSNQESISTLTLCFFLVFLYNNLFIHDCTQCDTQYQNKDHIYITNMLRPFEHNFGSLTHVYIIRWDWVSQGSVSSIKTIVGLIKDLRFSYKTQLSDFAFHLRCLDQMLQHFRVLWYFHRLCSTILA